MTSGIHHVTAISGRIDRTVDFYRRVLGLRLVKRTVNYDDPATYHLYFGDMVGPPRNDSDILSLAGRRPAD
jgi:glyoxalase family protein